MSELKIIVASFEIETLYPAPVIRVKGRLSYFSALCYGDAHDNLSKAKNIAVGFENYQRPLPLPVFTISFTN